MHHPLFANTSTQGCRNVYRVGLSNAFPLDQPYPLADLNPSALTYFAAFTTVKQRPLYNAGIGLCWGIGAILGPVIGGAFSVNHSATWRWAFYINLPLAAAFAPAYLFCFPHNDPRPELSFRSKLTQVDWIGALLNACAFVFFVIAVTFSGSSWAWNSGVAITMWVLSGASLLGSVLQQGLALGTSRPNRLFPAHLLKSRTMLLLFFATAASCSATAMCLYYIPLLFQFTRGDSALKAAVRLLPFIAPYVFAILLNGALLPITKRYTPWYITGGICILIAGVLLHNITPSTHTAAIYGFEVLLSIGTGVSFQVAYAVAASKLRHRDMPAAIGFVNVAQIGSIAIVLTIAGAIFQNRGYTNLRRALAGYNLPEETLRAALAGADSALAGAFDAKMEGLVVQAVVKTISTEFILVIVAGALMTISALFMKWERLNLEAAAAGA